MCDKDEDVEPQEPKIDRVMEHHEERKSYEGAEESKAEESKEDNNEDE